MPFFLLAPFTDLNFCRLLVRLLWVLGLRSAGGGQALGGSPNTALSPRGGKGIGLSTMEYESPPVSSIRPLLGFALSVRLFSSLGECSGGKLSY